MLSPAAASNPPETTAGPCTTSQSIAVVIDLDSSRSDDVPSDAVASLTTTVYSPGTAG